MVKKSIGIYGDITIQSPFNTDRLTIEVSNHHIACMVKLAVKDQIVALEVFQFDSLELEWYEIFQSVRSKSRVLERGFIDTKVFFNLPETVLIPEEKFSQQAANDYVELIHGNVIGQLIKTDTIQITPPVMVAYSVKRNLSDAINSNLMMITTRNSHSIITEHALSTKRAYNHTLLKVQLYYQEMLVCLIHDGKLLLTQLFEQSSQEDVLYHLLNVLHQFHLSTDETTIELSGVIEAKTTLYENVKKVFSKITFDNITEEQIFTDDFLKYPKHYFTPYLNLIQQA